MAFLEERGGRQGGRRELNRRVSSAPAISEGEEARHAGRGELRRRMSGVWVFAWMVVFYGGLAQSRTLAYECPKPMPATPSTLALGKGRYQLQVDAKGVAQLVESTRVFSGTRPGSPDSRPLSPRGAGPKDSSGRMIRGRILWKGVQLGANPSWAVLDGASRWLLVVWHRYGIKVVDPSGRIRVDVPYARLLTRRDLQKAGWKCGSWWAVSLKASFRHKMRRRRAGTLQETYLVLIFDWGRIVRVDLPSGHISRWMRRRRPGSRRSSH